MRKAKQKKYHLVYAIIHRDTDKWYVGVHSTDEPDDGYMGSSSDLAGEIEAQGVHQFEKIDLAWFTSRDLALACEHVILGEISKKKEVYNRRKGCHIQPGIVYVKKMVFGNGQPKQDHELVQELGGMSWWTIKAWEKKHGPFDTLEQMKEHMLANGRIRKDEQGNIRMVDLRTTRYADTYPGRKKKWEKPADGVRAARMVKRARNGDYDPEVCQRILALDEMGQRHRLPSMPFWRELPA